MPSGVAKREPPAPVAVVTIAADQPLRLVWENEVGGLTYEVGRDRERRFVKWHPPREAWRLDAEAPRLRWASRFTPVPAVLDQGHDADGAWLVTRALPGENAVAPRWTANPATAVRAIGEGLRALHDALPVATCPFSWSAPDRVANVHDRVESERLDPSSWHEIHDHLSVDDALRAVADPPPADQLVVCHGDACAPNTLLGEDGRWSGHVDLDSLGVADRWADLAVATWSTDWNYGPGWQPHLLDAYGIDPDPERTRYYRLLWALGP
jgi:kanamycin kinase